MHIHSTDASMKTTLAYLRQDSGKGQAAETAVSVLPELRCHTKVRFQSHFTISLNLILYWKLN